MLRPPVPVIPDARGGGSGRGPGYGLPGSVFAAFGRGPQSGREELARALEHGFGVVVLDGFGKDVEELSQEVGNTPGWHNRRHNFGAALVSGLCFSTYGTGSQLDKLGGSGPFQSLVFPRGGASSAMSRYYRDDFLDLSANLGFSGGVAITRDLQLVAEGYQFRMKGRIGLEDLALDAEGELQLGEELTMAIARTFGVDRIPLVEPVVIPIPSIRGTVTDPKPEPDFRYLLRLLTRNLPGVKGVQEILKGLDGVLQQQNRRP